MIDLPVDARRIGECVSFHTAREPGREAAVHGRTRLAYRDLDRVVTRWAAALLAAGVARGDRVASLTPPSTEWLTVMLATTEIGAVWTGYHPRYRPPEFRHVTGLAEPSVLIAFRRIHGRDYAGELTALKREHPSVRRPVTLDEPLDGGVTADGFLAEGASGAIAEPGGQGEIQARGDWLLAGYFRDPEATTDAYTADGWFRTGDVVKVWPDGNLEIVGRTKEMYISGGFNICPREVEIAIEAHPDVGLVAVLGVPDETFGEVGHAFVEPKPGARLDAQALDEWCRRAPRQLQDAQALRGTRGAAAPAHREDRQAGAEAGAGGARRVSAAASGWKTFRARRLRPVRTAHPSPAPLGLHGFPPSRE